jgi:hypothetical protein
MRMPPTDRPVDAIDSATERRSWNHLVTTVVAGTSPAAANATPNTPYTTNSCHCSSTCPSAASETPPITPPATITYRTSRRAITRATATPTTPPTTKNSVVASEIVLSGQPCSLLKALRYTARP